MKRALAIIFLGSALVSQAAAAQIRLPAASRPRQAPPARYQTDREITVEGTVASVLTNPAGGSPAGTHLLLTTSSGTVDAHLGIAALRGANAVAVSPGDKVKVVGVMAGLPGGKVLLVRTLQDGFRFYRIRSERGFLLRHVAIGPAAAGRAR